MTEDKDKGTNLANQLLEDLEKPQNTLDSIYYCRYNKLEKSHSEI